MTQNQKNKLPVRVLMIDDQKIVCEALRRMLENQKSQKIEFRPITDPTEAIDAALSFEPTVILQDLVMPQMDGLELLQRIRATAELKDIPMIVLSSKEDPEIKKQAFELGASDYMVKLPDPLEVLARLRHHSDSYNHLLARNKAEAALHLELAEAARYVRSLLPEPLETDALELSWVFLSSTELAGDAFFYEPIDADHFALYLLDVCGHGVGAALHSISVLNALRARSLNAVDFLSPASVLKGLNRTFPMADHNNVYFTMWCGIYQKSTQSLRYASAGHPPAVLVAPEGGHKELSSQGTAVGVMENSVYKNQEVPIQKNSKLYIFSDGVYEVEKGGAGGAMMEYEAFAEQLAKPLATQNSKPEAMLEWVRAFQGSEDFEDDFSLLECSFK